MPIYEYECRRCGKRTETMQRMSDPPLSECAECGGELRKLISAPAFQFKGTGWYVTDYARKSDKSESSSRGGEKGSDAETKSESSDSAKSEKSDSKSPDKADKADKDEKTEKAGKPKDTTPAATKKE